MQLEKVASPQIIRHALTVIVGYSAKKYCQSTTMTVFFDSIPDTSPDRQLCFYANATSQIQIVLIRNINNSSSRQRVVFPNQRLMFEASTSAVLVILTTERNKAIVTEVVPCRQLRATEVSTSTKSTLSTV